MRVRVHTKVFLCTLAVILLPTSFYYCQRHAPFGVIVTYIWGHSPAFRFSTSIKNSQMMMFAKSLVEAGKPVAVAVANDAYLPLAHSWLCNTKFMGIHNHLMIIVPDQSTRTKLKEKWPDVHVYAFDTTLGDINGAREFTTVGFQRITFFRAQIVKELLHMDLDVFVFELDAVWFQNPMPGIRARLRAADIAAIHINDDPLEIAVGLMYIRASDRTKALWTELTKRFQNLLFEYDHSQKELLISDRLNDQIFFSNLIDKGFANVQVVFIPTDIYADGRWYFEAKSDENIVLINNNFVVGVSNKIERAKKFNHWFWNMDTETCDFDLVRKISHQTSHIE